MHTRTPVSSLGHQHSKVITRHCSWNRQSSRHMLLRRTSRFHTADHRHTGRPSQARVLPRKCNACVPPSAGWPAHPCCTAPCACHVQVFGIRPGQHPAACASSGRPDQAATAGCPARASCSISMNCSKQTSASWGPGEASGWYWMLIACLGLHSSPAHVPSFRLMCVTSTSLGKVSGSIA